MASSAGAKQENEEDKKPLVEPHLDLTNKIKELEDLAKKSPLGRTCLVHIQDAPPLANLNDKKGSYVFIKKDTNQNPARAAELHFIDKDGKAELIQPTVDWSKLEKALDATKKTRPRLKQDLIADCITKVSKSGHVPYEHTPPWTVATGVTITYNESELHKVAPGIEEKMKASVGAFGATNVPHLPGAAAGAAAQDLNAVIAEYSSKIANHMDEVHKKRMSANFHDKGQWDLKKQEISDSTDEFVQRINSMDVSTERTACVQAQEALFAALQPSLPANSPLIQKHAILLPNATAQERQEFQAELKKAESLLPANSPLMAAATTATNNFVAIEKVKAEVVKATEEVAGPKLEEHAKAHAKWLKERLDNQNELIACMRAQAAFSDQLFSQYQGLNREAHKETEEMGEGYTVSGKGWQGDKTPHEILKHKSGEFFQAVYDKDKKIVTYNYLWNDKFFKFSLNPKTESGAKKINSLQILCLLENGCTEAYLDSRIKVAKSFLTMRGLVTNYGMQVAPLEAIAMTNRETGLVSSNINVGPHYVTEMPSADELKRNFRNSYLVKGDEVYRVDSNGDFLKSDKIDRAALEKKLPKKLLGLGPLKLQENAEKQYTDKDGKLVNAKSSVQDFASLFNLYQFLKDTDPTMLNENKQLFGFVTLMSVNTAISDIWNRQFANGGLGAKDLSQLNKYLEFVNQHSPAMALKLKEQMAQLSGAPSTQPPMIISQNAGSAASAPASSMTSGTAPSAPLSSISSSPPPVPSAPPPSPPPSPTSSSSVPAGIAVAATSKADALIEELKKMQKVFADLTTNVNEAKKIQDVTQALDAVIKIKDDRSSPVNKLDGFDKLVESAVNRGFNALSSAYETYQHDTFDEKEEKALANHAQLLAKTLASAVGSEHDKYLGLDGIAKMDSSSNNKVNEIFEKIKEGNYSVTDSPKHGM